MSKEIPIAITEPALTEFDFPGVDGTIKVDTQTVVGIGDFTQGLTQAERSALQPDAFVAKFCDDAAAERLLSFYRFALDPMVTLGGVGSNSFAMYVSGLEKPMPDSNLPRPLDEFEHTYHMPPLGSPRPYLAGGKAYEIAYSERAHNKQRTALLGLVGCSTTVGEGGALTVLGGKLVMVEPTALTAQLNGMQTELIGGSYGLHNVYSGALRPVLKKPPTQKNHLAPA